jgi:hypothetical protein
MNSHGHIALRNWLESLGATSDQLDRSMADEKSIGLLVERMLKNDWSSNLPIFFQSLEITIDHDAFVELAEAIAEKSLLSEEDAIIQLFALSNIPEYVSHLQFLTNLRGAFYSLERSALRRRASEIENQLFPNERDIEVAFNRIEAAEMKRKLKEIEEGEFAGTCNVRQEANTPVNRFSAKLFLRVAAIVITIIGSVWIFWPEKDKQLADNSEETIKSDGQELLNPNDSLGETGSTGTNENSPKHENAVENTTNVSPELPQRADSYIASYEILGEVNRGFGFSKKRSIAVEVLSSMSQLEVYNIQGDTLRLYVNDLNAFRNGSIIDLDKCLKENGSKSDCVFYVATQSGFYSIKWVQAQEPLQSVQDEQLITILKSYQP